jgi:hypothetical protein
VYQIAAGAERVITREGDRLYSQVTGGKRLAVLPVSPTEFYFEQNPLVHLVFARDDAQELTAETRGRLGTETTAKKTDKPRPASD